jgi:hypothetical protein
MAVIHPTTLSPSKLELLAAWLPAQSWYAAAGQQPELARAGGFRLDDPDGEVGIEFAALTDRQGERLVSYLLPLSYRGAPLAGAEHALIGTAEHGVLGQRWIYDGAHDPVLITQLLAAFHGRAEPQAQRVSNTPEPSVLIRPAWTARPGSIGSMSVTAGAGVTDVALQTVAAADGRPVRHILRLIRVLRPGADSAAPAGSVTAGWVLPDGTPLRGLFATLTRAPSPG